MEKIRKLYKETDKRVRCKVSYSLIQSLVFISIKEIATLANFCNNHAKLYLAVGYSSILIESRLATNHLVDVNALEKQTLNLLLN